MTAERVDHGATGADIVGRAEDEENFAGGPLHAAPTFPGNAGDAAVIRSATDATSTTEGDQQGIQGNPNQ